MLKLLKGESGTKSTTANVEENYVACNHTTVHKSLGDGERFQMLWNISFEDMTQKQIMEAAAEHLVIKIRRPFGKVDHPKNDDFNNVTFKAVDYISIRTSKVEKMAKGLADFTVEQLAELGLMPIKQ